MLDDEMLTIDELAAFLKLKPQTIYRWAQNGKIPGAKFGKEWRFRRSAIEHWIESHIRSSREAAPGKAGAAGGDGAGPASAQERAREAAPRKQVPKGRKTRGPERN